jgi:hypothetical protein
LLLHASADNIGAQYGGPNGWSQNTRRRVRKNQPAGRRNAGPIKTYQRESNLISCEGRASFFRPAAYPRREVRIAPDRSRPIEQPERAGAAYMSIARKMRSFDIRVVGHSNCQERHFSCMEQRLGCRQLCARAYRAGSSAGTAVGPKPIARRDFHCTAASPPTAAVERTCPDGADVPGAVIRIISSEPDPRSHTR